MLHRTFLALAITSSIPAVALVPSLLLAGSSGKNANFSYPASLVTQTGSVLQVFLVLVGAIALLLFLWGMMVMIFKAGDETERAKGKQRMVWGVIGLTVIFSVWGIVEILQVMFGTQNGDALRGPGIDILGASTGGGGNIDYSV